MKKSLVFRNSKFASNASGSAVTFSTTLGSSRVPFPEAQTTKKVKSRSATANLICVIKRVLEAGVNAQPTVLIGITRAMELTQMRSNFLRDQSSLRARCLLAATGFLAGPMGRKTFRVRFPRAQ